jgi:hypothetical protein
MTTDSTARPADETSSADGVASVITAGAMTFLLSGDLRLAVRATRLLIADGRENDPGGRGRRWKQPTLRSRVRG